MPSSGIQVAFWSCRRASCSSTALSGTGATVRVIRNPPVRSSVISGRTSTSMSNSIGLPTSNLRLRMEGSVMGLSDSLDLAVSQLSRITSSRTDCRMASPNRLRTTASGALPCRNPGKRARWA